MKKYLVAAVLIVALVTPALADAVHVMLNPTTHKCITTRSPGHMHGYKMMGKYLSLDEIVSPLAVATERLANHLVCSSSRTTDCGA
jgi:Trk K+ transport system NAD-binding subunit